MPKMRSLAIFLFLFLAVPGSGQLAWDGLPMSTRLELATLVLFVVFFASNQIRNRMKELLSQKAWVGSLKPVLLVLTVVKFGTFALLPLSDGFESCYRSLYYPIDNPTACEKSYELPIRPNGQFQNKSISRVDRVIDFGINPYDWSLPFVNDWRIQRLWLTRPPFSSSFDSLIENNSSEIRYLPILAIGEMSATNGNQKIEVSEYTHQYLSLLPITPGTSDFRLKYEYRDDELSIPPDTAPEPRGPYALLKVGVPSSIREIFDFATVNIGVRSTERIEGQAPASLSLTDRTGKVLYAAPYQGVDEISVPASSLELAPLTLSTSLNGVSQVLGSFQFSTQEPFGLQVSNQANESVGQELRMWLDSERDAFGAVEPSARKKISIPLSLLLRFIDFLSALIVVGLLVILISVVKRSLLTMVLLAIAGWIAVNPLNDFIPKILGGGRELVVPYMLIGILIIALQSKLKQHSFATFAPLAAVLAYEKVFDHLKFNHDDQGANWWGKLLFFWRDSDWFATNGFARIIFDTGSLQGGEDVFWFQGGPRYWAFVSRLLLGENDVLIGLIMTSFGFLSVIYLGTRIADLKPTRLRLISMFIVLFIGFIFQGDQLITAFAFVGSSEHPSWVVVFALTGYLLGRQCENRTWLLVTMSALLGFLINMRPNQIFLLSALFFLLLNVADRSDLAISIKRYGWMLSTFALTASLSLLHNIYYGGSFVPFAGNASINYAFEWSNLLGGKEASSTFTLLWTQFRTMLYWRGTPDPNLAITFWGSQLFWVLIVVSRLKSRSLRRRENLVLLLPFTYILPMLKYQTSSYYPRHLVIASLTFLCGALLAWAVRSTDKQTKSETHEALK
jgi:hypothetical protein